MHLGLQSSRQGRPLATTHEEIEKVAFPLFATQGFDGTTTSEIAEAAGISRRTLFRYYSNKADIPWGQFRESLTQLGLALAEIPGEIPLWEAVLQAVVDFNSFPDEALAQHEARMRLILNTPSLQAHSVLMYKQWREVIAEFVQIRRRTGQGDLLPRTVGHVSLSLALSAYEQWLSHPDTSLQRTIESAMYSLRDFVSE